MANDRTLIDWMLRDMVASEVHLKVGIGFTVLGIAWDPQNNSFYYNVALESSVSPVTKSSVLFKIAKLFDPLGWISAIIVIAKIFMQSLWVLTKEWDQVLPPTHFEY